MSHFLCDIGQVSNSSPYRQERRSHQRARLLVQVDCRGQSATSLGNSTDVSEQGLLMATPETLEPGTEVLIRFALPIPPKAIVIETKGVVVRSQPQRWMAIQFSGLPEAYREAIRQYVKAETASHIRSG
jgi:c-di-GMP-binding flagellar brake protein YcgR